MGRVFLLSPARLDGKRAQMLYAPTSKFPVAAELRSREGAELGKVFATISGLYFRGKLAYAGAFGAALVITQNRGLLPASARVGLDELRALGSTAIDAADPIFREPLLRDARALDGEVVLLGSIASPKYVEVLIEALGDRLLFPGAFIGRGDMSRGGLMLRAVEARAELEYLRVSGAVRHGARPAKLSSRTKA